MQERDKIKNGEEALSPIIWRLHAKQSQIFGGFICPAEIFSWGSMKNDYLKGYSRGKKKKEQPYIQVIVSFYK